MSISQSNKPPRPLSGPWKRFQLWRAQRMYARIPKLKDEAQRLFHEANRLVRMHSRPPPPLFDRLSSEDEQEQWQRGK